MTRDRERDRERERERERDPARHGERAHSTYSGTNSRSSRHRARSQLSHYPDDIGPEKFAAKAFVPSSGRGGASGGGSGTDMISPPPPPPPPPPSSSSSTASTSASWASPRSDDVMLYPTNATYGLGKPSLMRSASGGSVQNRSHHATSTSSQASTSGRSKHGSSSSGSSYAMHQRQLSGGGGGSSRRDANNSVLSESDRREGNGSWIPDSPPVSNYFAPPSSTSGNRNGSSGNGNVDAPVERSRSGSHATRRNETAKDDTPRRRARKMIEDDDDDDDDDGETKASGHGASDDTGGRKPRPVRIKYENTTRGIGGGKREISHASLGKLIARLTDAHQYDAEFRDVFLLTYRCFCSPYDFIKKLMKRYTAVLTLCGGLDADTLKETQQLLEQLTRDEENDRSSTSTSVSTAKSDINTNMEANVSIMRLLSVMKYWIKESGFIDMDLQNDRRAQKKLLTFLQEIQSTTPVSSIRQHAESLLMHVAQIVRQQNASPPAISGDSGAAPFYIPGPPTLTASTSVSSVSSNSDQQPEYAPRAVLERPNELSQSKLSSAMSKLKLTRSSSDSKKDKSMHKLRSKHSSGDFVHSYNDDPSQTFRKGSPMVTAPKMLRGVTTGSSEAEMMRYPSNPLEDVINDTIQRSRLSASRSSSRTSYDNAQPLSGVSAQELADQITLIEAEGYFARINRRELTNKAWTRETKYKEAPHVMALIEMFDATAEWVSSEILHPQLQAAERARLIMLFIDAADNCHQMNNYNTLFEITTGLSAPCIRQLNTTWGLVSASSQEKYQVLMQVCSPEDNYRNYRQAFALAEGQPRLPCSFILVKDLFTLEEAMKSIEDGLVNWQKFRKIYKVISEALEHQNMNYLPPDGSNAAGISRKGKGALRHDRKVQVHIRHRLDTIRKESTVLYQLARNANTQESILFVNSLSEAGFL